MDGNGSGLVVRDVSVVVRRTGTTIVEGVSLAVDAGSVLGVVGETGAGKTVTMKALLGLLPPALAASGSFRIGDEPWTPAGVQDRARRELLGRHFGVVLQNPAAMLDPVVRVGRQMTEGVRRRGTMGRREATGRAGTLLSAVGFKDPESVLHLYPHQLSGGMSQRVGIAMAMMSRPAALIVDEPTSALDAQLRVDVLTLIREMATKEGAAVIVVSHDLGLVTRFCDAIMVLYGGRVMEAGPAVRVLADPYHPYTAALVRCSPSIAAVPHEPLESIPGTPPAPGQLPHGCVFAPRCPHAYDRCHAERPALSDVPGARAACHLVEDGARGWKQASRA